MKTSKGIALRDEFFNDSDSAVYYTLLCDCGSTECDTCLELLYDYDFGEIELRINANRFLSHPSPMGFFERQIKKIRAAFKILFFGRLKAPCEVLIKGDQHLDDFIQALQEGREKLNKAET